MKKIRQYRTKSNKWSLCGVAIILILISVVIMLLFPLLAVTFVKGDAGMAVCFILFFAVNPIFSVTNGVFAGKDIKRLWSLPIIPAILFLLGTWIFFDIGELAFVLYAAVYLIIGIFSMLFSSFIGNKLQK